MRPKRKVWIGSDDEGLRSDWAIRLKVWGYAISEGESADILVVTSQDRCAIDDVRGLRQGFVLKRSPEYWMLVQEALKRAGKRRPGPRKKVA